MVAEVQVKRRREREIASLRSQRRKRKDEHRCNEGLRVVCLLCGIYGHRIFANQNSIESTSLSWLFECLLKDGTVLLFYEQKVGNFSNTEMNAKLIKIDIFKALLFLFEKYQILSVKEI
jgi:hypothetical protein